MFRQEGNTQSMIYNPRDCCTFRLNFSVKRSHSLSCTLKITRLLRTWKAVNLCFGSEFNIFLTRSLAAGEIDGHGSLVKSTWPRKIALNIPCSDSAMKNQKFFYLQLFLSLSNLTISAMKTNLE